MINYSQLAVTRWLPFLYLTQSAIHFWHLKLIEFLDYRSRLGLETVVQRQIHDISVYHMLRTLEPKQLIQYEL